MQEINVNLWDANADVICITTNGFVKKNGEVTMGAGCAKEAAQRHPSVPKALGDLVERKGNQLNFIGIFSRYTDEDGEEVQLNKMYRLYAFPVKHHWRDKADIDLIEASLRSLKELMDQETWYKVALPRPGCGNGRLDWETEVKPLVEEIFGDNDNLMIVHFPEGDTDAEHSEGSSVGEAGEEATKGQSEQDFLRMALRK